MKSLLGIGISVGVLPVAGVLLGIVSERLGAAMQSAVDGSSHAASTPDPTPAT
jgi:hypothetical protein